MSRKVNTGILDLNTEQASANAMISNNRNLMNKAAKTGKSKFKPKATKKTHRLNISVTSEIFDRLETQTELQGITLTDLVNQMLEYCLDELENS